MTELEKLKSFIVNLGQGNMGALSVMSRMTTDLDGIAAVHVLEYLPKLRGAAIWEYFKDTHGQDLEAMKSDLIRKGARLTQRAGGRGARRRKA